VIQTFIALKNPSSSAGFESANLGSYDILSIALYGCDTWCLTLREHRLRMLENRMATIIFEPRGMKWQEVGKDYVIRITIISTPHQLKTNNSTRIRFTRRIRDAYKRSVIKLGGKSSFERPWRRQEDNIKTDLIERKQKGVDWISIDQHRDQWLALVSSIMDLCILYKLENVLQYAYKDGFPCWYVNTRFNENSSATTTNITITTVITITQF
jgi:uncharacterized HAD superfamily protein